MTLGSHEDLAASPVVLQRALSLAGALTSTGSLSEARRALADATIEIASADDATCFFVDAELGELWADEHVSTWNKGIAGAAARTHSMVRVTDADADPRYCAETDVVCAGPRQRILAAPVFGPDGHVHAVVLAARRATHAAFDDATARALEGFCVHAGPMLMHVEKVVTNDEAVEIRKGPFRQEALDALGTPTLGRVVNIAPPWIGGVFWLVCMLVGVGGAFLGVASKHRYSVGSGIVRDGRRHAVVSHTAGTVQRVDVQVGESVELGQPLVVLDDSLLREELRRSLSERQRRVRQHLLDPDDDRGADAVAAIDVRLESVRARLRERQIVAPSSGIVADLRVREGRPISVGDVVATVDTGEGELQLVAFLPGEDRPGIEPGMQIRLEVPGYRQRQQWVTITSVEDGAVGPDEAARLAGREHARSLQLSGPTLLVEATLPDAFEADGRLYAYHDGMRGKAEVRLAKRRLLFLLLPYLEEVFE